MNAGPRLEALRARLDAEKVPAVLVSKASNVIYMTGFDRIFDEEEAHVAVVTQDQAVLYTDSRYADAARTAAAGTDWEIVRTHDSVFKEACASLSERGIRRLGAESSIAHERFERIIAAFDGEVVSASGWVEAIRAIKEPDEIRRMQAAQCLTDLAFNHILGAVGVGRTEHEIALELEFFMRKEGSEGVAFPAIVASGPNSAMPHAKVTTREIERGDLVKLDFGARIDGYCADMTRTVVIGAADERQKELYNVVLAANLAGISAAGPGLAGKELDAIARAVIVEHGFGDRFGHGLGHGVGLDVHESPRVGPRSNDTLVIGNVVTIEPGVYIPGYGGVRIEDLVVIEEGGGRVLTASEKSMIEL